MVLKRISEKITLIDQEEKMKQKIMSILLAIALLIGNVANLGTNTTMIKAQDNYAKETTDKLEGYDATFRITSEWDKHFNAEIQIKNTGKRQFIIVLFFSRQISRLKISGMDRL